MKPSEELAPLVLDFLQAGPRHLPELSRRFAPWPGGKPVGLLAAIWRLRAAGLVRWDQGEQVFTLTRGEPQEGGPNDET